jgi:hypothetical protein
MEYAENHLTPLSLSEKKGREDALTVKPSPSIGKNMKEKISHTANMSTVHSMNLTY